MKKDNKAEDKNQLSKKRIAKVLIFLSVCICVFVSIFANSKKIDVDKTNITNNTFTNENMQYNSIIKNTVNEVNNEQTSVKEENKQPIYNIDNIPPYTGQSYVELNNNMPAFKESDFTTNPFEDYSDLDDVDKGRCGVAFANICKEIMPTDKRKKITYKPTGWIQNEYPYIINTRQLYNRCGN